MKKIIFFFTFFTIIACNNNTHFIEKKTPTFSISVPDNLNETYDLNDEAVLQYKNDFQELYFVILEEAKEEMFYFPQLQKPTSEERINEYAKIIIENYRDSFDFKNFAGIKAKKINSQAAAFTSFNTHDDEADLDIYFHLTFVESSSHYFQILSWTLAEDETKHKATMEKIANSFKGFNGNIKLKKATK